MILYSSTLYSFNSCPFLLDAAYMNCMSRSSTCIDQTVPWMCLATWGSIQRGR
uniref:Uncharacterized protein n=1 Tax=Arundo donax TaxID=35708 RepID=A0A0A9H1C0_ARUDO